MSVRGVELDLEFPRSRHAQRRPFRSPSSASAATTAAYPAWDEKDGLRAERFSGLQCGLAFGEGTFDLALVGIVELRPPVEHRVNAHPDLVGDLAHFRGLVNRHHAC